MKRKPTIIKLSAIAVMLLCLATSCKKDASSGTSTANVTVSEQDAADAISDAVTPESAGLTAQASDATVMAASPSYPCGESFDSSILRSNSPGAAITYSFMLSWGWKLNCASPATFTASFKGNTVYDAVRMSSNDSSNGSFSITGLTIADDDYTFNTSYVRNGSQQSKVGNKNSFTSNITITSSNIKVDKTTREIVLGTATVKISGASSSGKSFNFNGTITFNGSKTAILQITGGASYNIAW